MAEPVAAPEPVVVPEAVVIRVPEPVPPPPPPAVIVIAPEKLELSQKVQFAYDSARIDSTSRRALDSVVAALQAHQAFSVEIEGHASAEGKDRHNQELSERRAQAVFDYLVHHGVAAERLTSRGFSSSQPVESDDTSSGREANRRVEFVVHVIISNERSGR